MPRGREKRKMRKIGRNRQQPQAAPFQRPTGQSKDGKVQKKIPGAESMIQCKSPGRTGQRAQPASLGRPRSRGGAGRFSSGGGTDGTARATCHRRAMVDAGWQGLRFSASDSAGRGCRRCGAGKTFLFELVQERSLLFLFLPFSLERKRKKWGEPTMVPP